MMGVGVGGMYVLKCASLCGRGMLEPEYWNLSTLYTLSSNVLCSGKMRVCRNKDLTECITAR
jgi:hypothetical protein